MNRLREKYMNKTFRIRFGFSCSDNRQSKTCTCDEPFDGAQDKLCRTVENRKWVGIFAIGLVLSAMVFALCSSAEAQQPTKIPRIGFLGLNSPSSNAARIETFRQGLRRAWVRGGQKHCH